MSREILGFLTLAPLIQINRHVSLAHGFNAMIVVPVRVNRRHGRFVVLVLRFGQPNRALALMVAMEVAQRGDAGAGRVLLSADLAESVPWKVAERFRAVFVTVLANQLVEGFREILVAWSSDIVRRVIRQPS